MLRMKPRHQNKEKIDENFIKKLKSKKKSIKKGGGRLKNVKSFDGVVNIDSLFLKKDSKSTYETINDRRVIFAKDVNPPFNFKNRSYKNAPHNGGIGGNIVEMSEYYVYKFDSSKYEV